MGARRTAAVRLVLPILIAVCVGAATTRVRETTSSKGALGPTTSSGARATTWCPTGRGPSGVEVDLSIATVEDLHVLSDIEEVRGTGYDDELEGDHKTNFLYGRRGEDRLRGRAGRDHLHGQRTTTP
jgi:Ca2+-binding RTX toxin-like protein